MRIISGKARGTKLFTKEGKDTRPTLDRVKESLFNIVQNEIQDSVVLDLFSGSGAIGLEFASRGAKKVILCDDSKEAIQIIKKNMEKTRLVENVEVHNCDFRKLLEKVKNEKFDIIYIDPPYKTDYIKQSLEIILKLKCTTDKALIIMETDEDERIKKDIQNLNLQISDFRKYGRAHLIFIRI